MFRNGEQQQIEEADGEADQQVLDRMDPGVVGDLGQEERYQRQQDEQHRIFGRAHGFLVLIDRAEKLRAKGGFQDFFVLAAPLLRIVAVEVQDLPLGGKTLLIDNPLIGEKQAGKAGVFPG